MAALHTAQPFPDVLCFYRLEAKLLLGRRGAQENISIELYVVLSSEGANRQDALESWPTPIIVTSMCMQQCLLLILIRGGMNSSI